MAKIKLPEPNLRTPDDQLSADEHFKINSRGVVGPLPERYADHGTPDLEKEAEFLSKSHGIYLEYNRAKTGREKDWMYMVRASIPGGGSFNAEQWGVFDQLADKYCDHNPEYGPSLRLTTRQNIQYHWLQKPQVAALVREIAQTGFYTLNGCGDNVRNVMGCPLSKFSTLCNAFELAHEYGTYFRIPAAPHIQVFAVDPADIQDPANHYSYGPKLLNRKFKIAFSTVHRDRDTGALTYDNCTELKTHDLGIAPIVEGDGFDAKVSGYQLYIGGGQGEKKGKPTFAAHGLPLGVVTREQLMPAMKAVVDVHKEWGDRQNRVWARLKYVVWKQGIDWYRDQVKAQGVDLHAAQPGHDVGPRLMHHGWQQQESDGKWAFGAYVNCGRLADRGDDRMKSMVPALLAEFPGVEATVTANQDLLFINVEEDARADFEARAAAFGQGKRNGKPVSTLRQLSGACVGLPTCRLSYTDSEQFSPELLDQLDAMGHGDRHESVGITGCERQCFRPGTKTVGWIGSGGDNYAIKLGGSEDGRHNGHWLADDENWYLSRVPRDEVAAVTAACFEIADEHKQDDETAGDTLRRIGYPTLINLFRLHPATAKHMEGRQQKAPFMPTLNGWGEPH